jgi:hypothetical protein
MTRCKRVVAIARGADARGLAIASAACAWFPQEPQHSTQRAPEALNDAALLWSASNRHQRVIAQPLGISLALTRCAVDKGSTAWQSVRPTTAVAGGAGSGPCTPQPHCLSTLRTGPQHQQCSLLTQWEVGVDVFASRDHELSHLLLALLGHHLCTTGSSTDMWGGEAGTKDCCSVTCCCSSMHLQPVRHTP